MPKVGGGLLAVLCDAAPGREQDLEDWYEHEHLYERSAIDGFLYSRRYISIQGEPRSLALYELTGPQVVHAEPYQSALLNERRAREARGPEAAELPMAGMIRNEYRLLESAGRHPGEFGAFVWMVREETGADNDDRLNAWYRDEMLPAVSEVHGVRGIKRYEATAGSPKYLTLYELATADIVDSDAWRKAFSSPSSDEVRRHIISTETNLAQFWKAVFPDEARAELATWSKRP